MGALLDEFLSSTGISKPGEIAVASYRGISAEVLPPALIIQFAISAPSICGLPSTHNVHTGRSSATRFLQGRLKVQLNEAETLLHSPLHVHADSIADIVSRANFEVSMFRPGLEDALTRHDYLPVPGSKFLLEHAYDVWWTVFLCDSAMIPIRYVLPLAWDVYVHRKDPQDVSRVA